MKVVAKSFLIFVVLLASLNGLLLAQSAAADQKQTSGKSVVNINTANQTELESLPGIGPSLAKKILDFRTKNGNFKAPADITAVQGIGDKKYEQIKNLITVK
jgi:competence protein ComEA